MVKSRGHEKVHSIHHYLVVGRHVPSEKNPNPKIYKMRIFANDRVRAKCKFWYFMKKLDKVKKASGEILACHEIFDRDPSKVKTYGIVCTYKSKYGYHNLYKEFRSTSLNGAVDQLYSEMVGRHKAQRESLVIVRTTILKGNVEKEAKRNYIRQVVKDGVKFPLLEKRIRPAPAFRKVFRPSRPCLIA
jgi:large subunit ribosomal protein L18Ae